MCTKAWRARLCKQGHHRWSWVTIDDVHKHELKHVCGHCGAHSEPLPPQRRTLWRAQHGLLDMRLFFPEIWRAHRELSVLKCVRWASIPVAVACATFSGYKFFYVAAIFAPLIATILVWAAELSVHKLEEGSDNG